MGVTQKHSKPKRFLIYLDPSMDKLVRQMAQTEERSLTGQVRYLLKIALDKLADEKDK